MEFRLSRVAVGEGGHGRPPRLQPLMPRPSGAWLRFRRTAVPRSYALQVAYVGGCVAAGAYRGRLVLPRRQNHSAVVTVIITGVNNVPAANDDSATTDEANAATVDVLANDTDVDTTDTLSVDSIDTAATVGSVTLANGVVTYDPNGQFEHLAVGETAIDEFGYTASDGHGGTNSAVVTVTITGLNDAPSANDDSATTDEANAAIVDVLANDTDVDATDTLSVGSIDTAATVGSVTLVDGVVTYDPNGQFEHLAPGESTTDTFGYTASDGHGVMDSALVTVTITGAGAAPTANDDSATTDEAGAITVDVLANDTDVDASDTLSVDSIDTTVTVGSVTLADGVVTYDPNGQFEHLAVGETATDTFGYTVSDGHGGTDTASVTVTITGLNDAPDPVDDSIETDEDTLAARSVLANDTDPDTSDTLTLTGVDAAATIGSVHWHPDGSLAYDPNGQFDHLAVGDTTTDTFTYTVSDGHEAVTATAIVTIHGVNDSPYAADDVAATSDDTSTSGNLLANDSDPDTTDVLSVTSVDTSGTQGTVIWSEDGTFTYDPADAFVYLAVGESATDTFGYTASDGHGETDSALVTVTITGAGAAPTANDDSATTDEASSITVDVLANDTDLDASDTLSVDSIDTTDAVGLVTLVDGIVTYDPNGQFEYVAVGETATDTFGYTVSDGNGGADTASVTVTITGLNDALDAVDDSIETDAHTPAVQWVLANDTDPDTSDTLSVTDVDDTATIGSIYWDPDGFVSYDPNGQFEHLAAGETATDAFVYTASDAGGATDTGTVTVTITGLNDPSTINGTATGSIDEDATADVTGVLSVSDVDDGEAAFTAQSGVLGDYGTFSIDAAGNWTYTLDNNAVQDLNAEDEVGDSFSVNSVDGTASQAVVITIAGLNDAAAIGGTAAGSTDEDATSGVTGVLSVTDVDDGEAVFTAQSSVAGSYGTFSIDAAGNWNYTLDNNAVQDLNAGDEVVDSFNVSSVDGTANQAVVITISGLNDPSTISGTATGSTDEDATADVTGVLSVSDVDDGEAVFTAQSDMLGNYGTFSINAAGNWTYTLDNSAVQDLNAGDEVVDSFSVSSVDGTASQVVVITITGGNEMPEAVDDTIETDEDTLATTCVIRNDTDPDQSSELTLIGVDDSATIGLVYWSSDGGVVFDPNGQFEYLAVGEPARYSFTYTVSDDHGETDTATVRITITGVNDMPEAVDDRDAGFETDEDAVFTTGNVLANDSDPDASDTITPSGFDTTGTQGVVSDNGDGTFTYDPDGQFEYLAVGEIATDTFTYTISDGNGQSASAHVTIAITGVNDAPSAFVDGPTSGFEGEPVQLIGTAADADASDMLQYQWNVTKDGSPIASGTGSAFEFTPDDNGTYLAVLGVDDGNGGSATATHPVSVGNVAPTASLTGPTAGVRGERLTFHGSFSDPGTADTHDTAWEIFDSNGNQIAAATGPTWAGVFVEADTYAVNFTVTDDDGAADTRQQSVVVEPWMLTDCPTDPTQQVLLVGGTDGRDHITVKFKGGALDVKVDEKDMHVKETFKIHSPVCRIVMYGQAGDDKLTLSNKVTIDADLYGGDGRDKLYGGRGNDYLSGGAGNDTLFGDEGDDILIGGPGDDNIHGGAGDDVILDHEGDTMEPLYAAFSRWTNVDNCWDTTGDGLVTPMDVLSIVNYLNGFGTLSATGTPPESQQDAFFLDANGDYQVTPLDVLWIINYLNFAATGEGEGDLTQPSRAQAGVGEEIVSLSIAAEPSALTSPSSPIDPLPAGVRLIDVPWPTSTITETNSVDRFWSGVTGEIQDTAAVPQPSVPKRPGASRGQLLEETTDIDEEKETGILHEDLESAMDDIASDITQAWTAHKASR